MQGEPPKCDRRLAAPSGSPRRPADPASPSTSSRELRCATPLLATYGDASNIETPAASASQPIWHFQRSSVPKQSRPDIRSQDSWQVSQSNWPPTDWAAGLSAAGIVKTVLRKGESCRVECGTDRRRTPGDQCESEVRPVQLPGYALGVAGCGPVRNTSRNLPICTSSPFASTAQSTGSRLTNVPLRLPTSTTGIRRLPTGTRRAGG